MTHDTSPMTLVRRPQRIESAAAAGLAYSILSVATLLILRSQRAAAANRQDWTAWIGEDGNRQLLASALGMSSVSAVAFLWFVAVVRRRVGSREDQFFSTVFLGSALVYVSLWLVAVALAASPALLADDAGGTLDWDAIRLADGTATGLLLVAGPRIQAVFIASTSTVLLRSRAAPLWLSYLGYAIAISMFVVPFVTNPVGIGMPSFVFVASITILVISRFGPDGAEPSVEPPPEQTGPFATD